MIPDLHGLPICIGQMGYDITSMDNMPPRQSFGGAALHFVVAASTMGLSFSVYSYVNHDEWKEILEVLSLSGVDVCSIVNSEQTIQFHLSYDKDLAFMTDKFCMVLPTNEPDILDGFNGHKDNHFPFIHICPTTPDQDQRYFKISRRVGEIVSIQMAISNLTKNLSFYQYTLSQADYVFLNLLEAKLLTKSIDADMAYARLRKFTDTCFYITSEEQVVVIYLNNITSYKTPKNIKVIDPTGAGDVFAGACTAIRMLTGNQDIAVRVGMLAASVKLSSFSSTNLLNMLKKNNLH